MLGLLSSISSHPSLAHLLTLPVFSPGTTPTSDETTLSTLVSKLRNITLTYQRTFKYVLLSPILLSVHSLIPPCRASPAFKPPVPPPPFDNLDTLVPRIPRLVRPHPPAPPTTDETATDLAELVSKILATSEKVAAAVKELLAGRPGTEKDGGKDRDSVDVYMNTMKELQFGKDLRVE